MMIKRDHVLMTSLGVLVKNQYTSKFSQIDILYRMSNKLLV